MKSLVIVDGHEHKEFPTLQMGENYFAKMKNKYKGTLTLIAIYKKVNGKWIGHKHN